MLCEPTDAYDLVILLLFLIFDNDCCCRCACANKHIFLCAFRFCINYVTTLGQIVIIIVTNDFDESMTQTSRDLYNTALAMFSIFGFVAFMFLLLSLRIKCEGLAKDCGGYKACPQNRNLVFPMLVTSCVMMLVMDIFMFTFTTVYGTQQGEKIIDFSSFGDGFRSCMFLISIFDMMHAFVGIFIVIYSRKKVLSRIMPEDSTGTYLERERYKLDKEMEYYRSGQFERDMNKHLAEYLEQIT